MLLLLLALVLFAVERLADGGFLGTVKTYAVVVAFAVSVTVLGLDVRAALGGHGQPRVELVDLDVPRPRRTADRRLKVYPRKGDKAWAVYSEATNEAFRRSDLDLRAEYDKTFDLSLRNLLGELRREGMWPGRYDLRGRIRTWAWMNALRGHPTLSPWESRKPRLGTDVFELGHGDQDGPFALRFGATSYRAGVLTNHRVSNAGALRLRRRESWQKLPDGRKLQGWWRGSEQDGLPLLPPGTSRLANSIGVSVIAMTADHHLVLPVQTAHNNLSKNSLAPSGSGGVDWPAEWGLWTRVRRFRFRKAPIEAFGAWLRGEARREMIEECGLPDRMASQIAVEDVRPLGIAAIGHWGGHVEFFYSCRLPWTKEELAQCVEQTSVELPFTVHLASVQCHVEDGAAYPPPAIAGNVSWIKGPSEMLPDPPPTETVSFPLELALHFLRATGFPERSPHHADELPAGEPASLRHDSA